MFKFFKKKNKKIKRFIFPFLFCLVVILILFQKLGQLEFPDYDFSKSQIPFDSVEWKQCDKVGGTRDMMRNDLIENYLSINSQSKEEIIELLGKPDKEDFGYFYYLLSIGFDPCYLIFDFEESLLTSIKRECH